MAKSSKPSDGFQPLAALAGQSSLEMIRNWPWERQWQAIIAFTLGPAWSSKVQSVRWDDKKLVLFIPEQSARTALEPLLPSLALGFKKVLGWRPFLLIES